MASKNVYQKLQEVRVKFQGLNLPKNGKNTYAGFDYYLLEDIIPYINTLFNEIGLFSKFDLIKMQDDNVHNKAVLTITNVDNPLDFVTFEMYSVLAKGQIKGIQAIGSENTYMKRYLYLNALEITEGDTVDATNGEKNAEEDRKDELKKLKKLEDLVKSTENEALTEMHTKLMSLATDKYKKKKLSELDTDVIKKCVKNLEKVRLEQGVKYPVPEPKKKAEPKKTPTKKEAK